MPIIKIRRGTTTQWTASTRVLQVGELGLDTTLNKLKAGNGTAIWNNLPFLQADADITESAQDAVATALANGTHSNITVTYNDNANSISLATGPDVITQTSLSNTLTDPTTGYVAIGDVGQADGVASLGSNGKIPDSEIPDSIARDSELKRTAVQWTANHYQLEGGANTRYLAGDVVYNAGNLYVANFDNESLPTSNTEYWTLIGTGNRLNIDGRDIPNILWDNILQKPTIPSLTGYATETYVGTAITNLVDTAPETLNTLNELAAAINDDASFASTVTTALGNKLDSSTAATTYLTQSNASSTYATQSSLDLKLDLSSPSIDYYITNSGSGAYLVNGVSNGLITFEKGKKYRIHINASSHPFWIQTVSGEYSAGNVYSTGITNGGAQVGHILVELPQNAPDNLYYACQYHSSMKGSISVKSSNTITTNAQVSNYTIAPIDSERLIEMSGGGTLTITDSASFPIGFYVDVLQTGSSQVTIAGTSFTPNATPGLKLRTQWSSATLIKRALNSWVVLGDLSA